MALQFSENRQRNIGLSVTSNPRTVLNSVGLLEASQAEAIAGAVQNRYMSPLRTSQVLASGSLPGSFTTLDVSTDLTLANAVWIKGRNAANTADLNMWRVNSSNYTEWSNPLYFDTDSAFTNRNAKITIQHNTGSSAPSAIIPNFWSLVQTKGDNATLIGASAGYFHVADRSDVVAGTKGCLYGIQVNVAPIVARSNTPFDDAAGVVVQNAGTAKATDAIYVGRSSTLAGKEWVTGVLVDTDADYAYRAQGSYDYGLDFVAGTPCTFSTAAIRLPNNSNISGRNAAGSADINIARLASDNGVYMRDGELAVYSTHVLFSQPALIPNTGLQIFDTDSSHRTTISIGSDITAARDLILVTGDASRTITLSGNPTLSDWFDQSVKTTASPTFASAILSGNISAAAWTTTGLRFRSVAATLTDTSSSGTVPTAYTSYLSADTVAASSATTYTNYYGAFFDRPVAGTNVTMTDRWGLGANTAKITSGVASTSKTTGALVVTGGVGISGGGVANSFVVHSATQSMFAFWKASGAQGYLLGRSSGADDAQNFFLYDSDSGFILQADSSRNVSVVVDTASTSSTTGALKVAGGAGIVKSLWVGESIQTTAPVTKTGDFTVAVTENYLIVNVAGTTTVTLPAAASFTGRVLWFKTIQAQLVNSNASNVVPNTTGTAGTAILPATDGAWCMMVSDGTNWIRMASSTIA
jgi:hypothetical protein